MAKNTDILSDHFKGTEKSLSICFGKDHISELMDAIRKEYAILAPEMPYIGGEENMFTEWLIYGVYYLAVHRVLQSEGLSLEEGGKIIFDAFEAMADYPRWMLRAAARLKYSERYVQRLKAAAVQTQERRFPGDWVAEFIEGDGVEFDYGLDITECGICKFYRSMDAEELAPYLCLSDFVVSRAMDRGLVRYKTLAEGSEVCDFRFKRGRETFVNPLRSGWPPKFLNIDS